MTITFLLVLALGGVAIAVSLLVNRRSPDSPTVPRFVLPFQLDRSDFERPDSEWLLVLFSSETCDSCVTVLDQISSFAIPVLHIQNVEFPSNESLHNKYSVRSVPSLLLVDPKGVVEWSFAGIPPKGALFEALEHLGIVPPETDQQVQIS
ncbi:MAG: thioredoxin family protein [Acidimicrobiales bacterium]|jgi:thioredoxin-related protein|nr:thioredoxin family protein [Acidimicrobiales bacterium]MDP6299338.1 thioredoxin family protein [Acidimicrobiales bacterium]HJM29002.1 thioredoxin family protein [Acidimicrobiales bacterium]HJM98526.1 thioredoxin family protein [Acidimicrobiales bacterium]